MGVCLHQCAVYLAILNQYLLCKVCIYIFDWLLYRTEELTSCQFAEIEEDLQQHLARTETRVREEVRSHVHCHDML